MYELGAYSMNVAPVKIGSNIISIIVHKNIMNVAS